MEEKQKNSPEEFEVETQTISEEELANVAGGGCTDKKCSICKQTFTEHELPYHMVMKHGATLERGGHAS